MHSILRIDEVKKQGQAKISAFEGGNVAQFPLTMYRPGQRARHRRNISLNPIVRAERLGGVRIRREALRKGAIP